jgi:hypothetical protein
MCTLIASSREYPAADPPKSGLTQNSNNEAAKDQSSEFTLVKVESFQA